MTLFIKDRYALSQNPISGGMAEVFQAYDTLTNKTVAVKLFKQDQFEDEFQNLAFKRETKALQDLKHKNIVEILDSGIDEGSQRHYIVLEWVEQNLSEWLDSNDLGGWDDFYEQVGKPVLDALCFAHENGWVHRDLKPGNILISKDGVIKITDFGIAKSKRVVEPGATLARYGTEPYTPPEYDDGMFTYTRDVFSFGVLALRCLIDTPFKSYDDLKTAFEEFNAPPEILPIIENSISLKPEERPIDANTLLYDLERIWLNRKKRFEPPRTCYLKLTFRAEEYVRKILGVSVTHSEIRHFILTDLNTTFGIKVQDKIANIETNQIIQYEIYGETCRYIAVVDNREENHLVVKQVKLQSPAFLEKLREESWIPTARFDFQEGKPLNNNDAINAIKYLQTEVDWFEQELAAEKRAKAEQKLLDTWEAILRAKTEYDKGKNQFIEYKWFSINGSRVTFSLVSVPPDDLIGQSRLVRTPQGDVRGEIESIQGNEVVLYLQSDCDPNLLRKTGTLEFDTRAADVALRRQKDALDAIRFERSVNKQLRNLIIHPETSSVPEYITKISFVNEKLDEAKKSAVEKALGIKDFLIVEGPPGTGKTTFIAELVVQWLRRDPDLRILLTSQTHVALDNAITGISKLSPGLKIVRVVGPMGGAKVEGIAQSYQVENLLRSWQKEAVNSGTKFLEEFAKKNGIATNELAFGVLLKELIIYRKNLNREKDEKYLKEIELDQVGEFEIGGVQSSSETTRQVTEELNTELKKISANIKAIEKQINRIENDLINLNELGKELILESNEELNEWVDEYLPNTPEIKKYLELENIHANWKAQFGIRQEFEVALVSTAQVIAGTCLGIVGGRGYQDITYDLCIVDEASKASPTEVLIPLSRSKNWILVGDQKQLSPFQDPAFIHSDSLKLSTRQ